MLRRQSSYCIVYDVNRLTGTIPHTATIGDVNGDGLLDVVVSTASDKGYHIYALRGDNGNSNTNMVLYVT
jgi:hypothetical protein